MNGMSFHYYRCATGEAWPDIMLDATSGRDCDPEAIDYNITILEDGAIYSK